MTAWPPVRTGAALPRRDRAGSCCTTADSDELNHTTPCLNAEGESAAPSPLLLPGSSLVSPQFMQLHIELVEGADPAENASLHAGLSGVLCHTGANANTWQPGLCPQLPLCSCTLSPRAQGEQIHLQPVSLQSQLSFLKKG